MVLDKKSVETLTFEMDFSTRFRDKQSIASVDSVTATNLNYVTSSVPITVASITFDGDIALFQLAAGTVDEEYTIAVTVTTTSSDVVV